MSGQRRSAGRKATHRKGMSSTGRFFSRIYHSVVAMISAGISLLLLLSASSQWINPHRFHYVSFLGLAFGFLLLAALLWIVVLIVLHRWRNLIVMGCTLLLLLYPISLTFPIHFGTQQAAADADGEIDSLRVLTYNTYALGGAQLNKGKEALPVINMIRASGADLVCLQEYAFTNRKGGHTQEKLRQALSDIYPYYDFTPASGRTIFGIAVFSKHPIRKAERIDKRKKGYVSAMYYRIALGRREIGLVNYHLHTNAIKVRDRHLAEGMIERFDTDSLMRMREGPIRQLGAAFISRATESRLIRQFLDDVHPGNLPLIVCGDMNDTPISYCYHTIRGQLRDAWQDAGFGPGITYNRHHFWFRIDHILHSDHLMALDAKVLDEYDYSDHYPVMATFQLLPL